jgi:hypothetical protein
VQDADGDTMLHKVFLHGNLSMGTKIWRREEGGGMRDEGWGRREEGGGMRDEGWEMRDERKGVCWIF